MNIQRGIAHQSAAAVPRSQLPYLLKLYQEIRSATEELADRLSAEDQMIQSMPDASPTKWHRAHTAWFFEAFILSRVDGYKYFDPKYSYLFNSYYDAVGARHPRPDRGLLSRPATTEVTAYRQHVDEWMLDLLASGADEETERLVEVGLNHEEQHQELLLTDILHAFAQNPLKPAYTSFHPGDLASSDRLTFEQFEGGLVETGHAGEGFAFDNEGPRHQVFLQPFSLASRSTTNADWLEFMAADGYRNPKYWLSDGWQHVEQQNWRAPLYWEQHDGQWFTMTLSGLQPLDLHAPVTHVSFYEADAFARWCGKRLPTEAEWEHVAASRNSAEGNFREAGFLRPVGSASQSMFGNVWEWTASPYVSYPGYRADQGALGEYNGKFMVNQMVLRGGSCVTSRRHIRPTYRNFFYPHQRWQFSGLRLADDRQRAVRKRTVSLFLEDVWAGLSRPQKRLSSKYFYDAEGAQLFEQICSLPEYYLTRTECRLLHGLATELAQILEPETALVEYGCGSCLKTRILLDDVPQLSEYVPLDICGEGLSAISAALAAEYPLLQIGPVIGDFMQPLLLPEKLRARPLLGFFPGSTIGNLTAEEADAFLSRARETLGMSGKLLIGLDLLKDAATLLRAYDDAAGVTAAFNKNVLAHINRELDGDFDLHAFEHSVRWDIEKQRVEMHLVSSRTQTVTVGGRPFYFRQGETIHTENCHKYNLDDFAKRATRCGWAMEKVWVSSDPEFAVMLLA